MTGVEAVDAAVVTLLDVVRIAAHFNPDLPADIRAAWIAVDEAARAAAQR